MKTKNLLTVFVLFTVIVTAITGCSSNTKITDKKENKNQMTESNLTQRADSLAEIELEKFNKTKEATYAGGPFLLIDYEREFSLDSLKMNAHIFYNYKKPVNFLGYPQHFSVTIDLKINKIQFFGGR